MSRKFDDEDNDVLDSWDIESEEEVEVVEEEKKKTVPHKLRVEQRIQERKLMEGEEEEEEEEDPLERKRRLHNLQIESDMKNIDDLFDGATVTVRSTAPLDWNKDISDFKPTNKADFDQLTLKIAPFLSGFSKSAQYVPFLQDLVKQLSQNLNSEQIKKVASTMTALANERLKEEKSANQKGKKKTKPSLATQRAQVDTNAYDEALDDEFDDFM